MNDPRQTVLRARRIDAAIDRLVEEAHERALTVLRENRATLDAIAAALVRDESLNRDELIAIVTVTFVACGDCAQSEAAMRAVADAHGVGGLARVLHPLLGYTPGCCN